MIKHSFYVLFIFAAIKAAVAIGGELKSNGEVAGRVISLGNAGYKHDPKYSPINGRIDGKGFYLHYCWPGVVAHRDGGCNISSPEDDPRSIRVHFGYWLGRADEKSVPLEGEVIAFPFPLNVDLENKTPYIEQYRARERILAEYGGGFHAAQVGSGYGYQGLIRYNASARTSSWWWVPKDTSNVTTKLGNPPIFSCNGKYCLITIDQGDGWVATAMFHEGILSEWRVFFEQLNVAIDKAMEQ